MEKAGHDLSGSFGLEGLLEFGGCNMSGRSRLVIGENGSKVELIEYVAKAFSSPDPMLTERSPYTFFEENVLKADPARLWLETRLSVANKLKRMLKNIIAAPKIWLLTGVYYMENAQVYTIRTKSSSADAKITVPIPEPSGIAAMLGANAGAKFSLGNQWEIEAGAQISGKRVWAAQWTRVGARFFLAEDASTELSPKQLRLLDVWSVGTERGDDEPWTTELSLLEKGSDEGAEAGQEYDEKTWKEFEEDVERLLDDLAETD